MRPAATASFETILEEPDWTRLAHAYAVATDAPVHLDGADAELEALANRAGREACRALLAVAQ